MADIRYETNTSVSTAEFVSLLKSSTLGERRPIDDLECIEGMLKNSNLIISAWHKDKLVGISRSVTDFNYCCYLSDLAVDSEHQGQGVGKELLKITKKSLRASCMIILLSAPVAVNYYPQLGFNKHESAWMLSPNTEIQ